MYIVCACAQMVASCDSALLEEDEEQKVDEEGVGGIEGVLCPGPASPGRVWQMPTRPQGGQVFSDAMYGDGEKVGGGGLEEWEEEKKPGVVAKAKMKIPASAKAGEEKAAAADPPPSSAATALAEPVPVTMCGVMEIVGRIKGLLAQGISFGSCGLGWLEVPVACPTVPPIEPFLPVASDQVCILDIHIY